MSTTVPHPLQSVKAEAVLALCVTFIKHDTVICWRLCLEGIQGWGVLAWVRLICFGLGWITNYFSLWHLSLGDPSPNDRCRFVNTELIWSCCCHMGATEPGQSVQRRSMRQSGHPLLITHQLVVKTEAADLCYSGSTSLYSTRFVGYREKTGWREVKGWTVTETKYPKGWPCWC